MRSNKCQCYILIKSIFRKQCFCPQGTINCNRYISQINNRLAKNHYDVLGISPKATATDIKSAYYRLSMMYHPDKNKGCEESAKKFRDITTAYEVLGSFRLRRLYDKGIIHTAGPEVRYTAESETVTVEEDDDAQTKFYKRHMKRTQAPDMTGRTPIYDFDEWNSAHYGQAFARSQAARHKYNTKEERATMEQNVYKNEMFMFGLIMLTLSMVLITVIIEKSHDVDRIDESPINVNKSNES